METNGTTEHVEIDKAEISQLTSISNESLYLLTKAEIDTAISTAKAFPRSLKKFLDKATSMATLTEDIAASCSYSLPRGGRSLDGPSVRLAEIVCASYTNIRAGARVIANDGKTITAQGICHDLENNNSVTVEVKRKITDKQGRTFSEDMQVVTGNAACAIAYRNAVFKVVPAALINDVYEKAKEVARGTAETLIVRRDKALAYFRNLKVTDAQICEVLGIVKVEDIDLDNLSTLTGMRAAIKNGEATVQSLFEKVAEEEITAQALMDLLTEKSDLLSDKEKEDATRIITKKESESYKKLYDKLSKMKPAN